MKYIDEFRDPALARRLIAQIRRESQPILDAYDPCG